MIGGQRAYVAKLTDDEAPPLSLAVWVDDPYCYSQACTEVIRTLSRFRPQGPIEGPPHPPLTENEQDELYGLLMPLIDPERPQAAEASAKQRLASS